MPVRRRLQYEAEEDDNDEDEEVEEKTAGEEDEAPRDGMPSPGKSEEAEENVSPSAARNQSRHDANNEDFWVLNGTNLYRYHRQPRVELFVPTELNCPLPLKFLDVQRFTDTDLEDPSERSIEDFWITDGEVSLSEAWTGKTRIPILNRRPERGHEWVDGRKTKIQKNSQRPGNIWPEVWEGSSAEQKKKYINNWKALKPRQDEARAKHGNRLWIPDDDLPTYERVIAKVQKDTKPAEAPAMPVVMSSTGGQAPGDRKQPSRPHQDKVSTAGFVSGEWFALVPA